MSNNKISEYYVLTQIRKYALKQLWSVETPATMVIIVLMAYMIYLFRSRGVTTFSGILFVILICVCLFGLYETVPALIMLWFPYNSKVFRMKATTQEKMQMCTDVDKERLSKTRVDYTDMSATDSFLIIHGRDDLEVMRWDDIKSLIKKEYPSRKKYKGLFFLYFVDKKGRKHELDVQNGQNFSPVRQVNQIFLYLKEHHPEIQINMSAKDQQRLDDMIAEDKMKQSLVFRK